VVRVLTKSYKADILEVSLLLELKIVNSIYFYFILFYFCILNLELGVSIMSQTVTQYDTILHLCCKL